MTRNARCRSENEKETLRFDSCHTFNVVYLKSAAVRAESTRLWITTTSHLVHFRMPNDQHWPHFVLSFIHFFSLSFFKLCNLVFSLSLYFCVIFFRFTIFSFVLTINLCVCACLCIRGLYSSQFIIFQLCLIKMHSVSLSTFFLRSQCNYHDFHILVLKLQWSKVWYAFAGTKDCFSVVVQYE